MSCWICCFVLFRSTHNELEKHRWIATYSLRLYVTLTVKRRSLGVTLPQSGYSISLNFQRISRNFADFGRNKPTIVKRMKIDRHCRRQRCKHVELEQFWHAFASRGFVSDNWAFLYWSVAYRNREATHSSLFCSRINSVTLASCIV